LIFFTEFLQGFYIVNPGCNRERQKHHLRIAWESFFDAFQLCGHVRTNVIALGEKEISHIDLPFQRFAVKQDAILIVKRKGLDSMTDLGLGLSFADKIGCKIGAVVKGDGRLLGL
jgi:restriction endonuclease Mrr